MLTGRGSQQKLEKARVNRVYVMETIPSNLSIFGPWWGAEGGAYRPPAASRHARLPDAILHVTSDDSTRPSATSGTMTPKLALSIHDKPPPGPLRHFGA